MVGFYALFEYQVSRHERITSDLTKDFLLIKKEEELFGTITDVWQNDPSVFRNHPHQAYITIDDSIKRMLTVGYEIQTNQKLDSILEPNQYIKKSKGSTMVKLTNQNDDEFIFHLTDGLGYPLNKN